jgi:hypothetical protein
MTSPGTKLTTKTKIKIFHDLFLGSVEAYGTYDPQTKTYRQIKQPVTDQVMYNHLSGKQPYGFYLLVKDQTNVGVIDLDRDEPESVLGLCARAAHYQLPCIVEISKSKGYHLWFFFGDGGIKAWKARAVLQLLLDDLNLDDVEVFPKQDRVDIKNSYGNFINAPLFGKAVQNGRTILIDPGNGLEPVMNPWQALQDVARINENHLDDLIDLNDLALPAKPPKRKGDQESGKFYSLPSCIKNLLEAGTNYDQRIATFRLAVNLKWVGIPQDLAQSLLLEWRIKNKPSNAKQIITIAEVDAQVNWAFQKNYRGIGCEEPVIRQFCQKSCQIKLNHNKRSIYHADHHTKIPH